MLLYRAVYIFVYLSAKLSILHKPLFVFGTSIHFHPHLKQNVADSDTNTLSGTVFVVGDKYPPPHQHLFLSLFKSKVGIQIRGGGAIAHA